jgi:adenylate cyclase
MSETRKLAAILAADVVGFSRLTGLDEEGTLAQLRRLRADVVDPATTAHGGRIFKRTGDGFLAEFRSAVDAVRCAIGIQAQLSALAESAPSGRRIAMRMGVHVGDVIEEADGDLMGDSVNVAARLEGIAEPGGVCLSDQAYYQVRGKIDIAAKDGGLRRLKNISEPVRIFSLQPGTKTAAFNAAAPARWSPRLRRTIAATAVIGLVVVAAAATLRPFFRFPAEISTAAVAKRFSIVILPFSNLSADSSQDYFVDALVDELTTYVSRIPEAFVISRNSAFTFKGKAVDVRQIGSVLGVRYALEGSIQFNQQRARVNAQLVETATATHVWAEDFEEERADLFQMEDDIVTRLARALDIQFTAVEAARADRVRPDNASAQELAWQCAAGFSEARLSGVDADRHAQAMQQCQRALQIDPNNFLALRTEAAALVWTINSGQSVNMMSDMQRAAGLGIRLIALRPESSDAHLIKGEMAFMTGFLERAEAEFRASVAANPVNMEARFELCDVQTAEGRSQSAIDCFEQFERASPRDPLLFDVYYEKGSNYEILQRFEDALAWTDRALSLAPEHPPALRLRAALLLNLGRDSEARAAYERYRALPGTNISTVSQYKSYLSKAWISKNPAIEGTIGRRVEALRKLGMPE